MARWRTKLFSISTNKQIGNKKTDFKHIGNRKSKGLSDETIKPSATSDNSFNPLIDYVDDKIRLKFNVSCLKQPKIHSRNKGNNLHCL